MIERGEDVEIKDRIIEGDLSLSKATNTGQSIPSLAPI